MLTSILASEVDIRKAIEEIDPDAVDELSPLVTPFVIADTEDEAVDEATIAIGQSKFCGKPDLPNGFAWPMTEDGPCHFVGQLDLQEVAKFKIIYDIPKEGILSFFFHDRGCTPVGTQSAVYYFPDKAVLRRTEVVIDTRWDNYHEEHLFARNLLLRQGYGIGCEEDISSSSTDDSASIFNENYGLETHRFFNVPMYDFHRPTSDIILASFGEWSDRLVFPISEDDLAEWKFDSLEVDFHCT